MHAVRLLPTLAMRLLSLALPPRCPGCGAVTRADHSFCVTCWSALDFLGAPCCACCGEPFLHDRGPEARCGACLADPPAFDHARAAVSYGDIARHIALRLKYGGRPGLAETIARRLDRLVEHGEPDPIVIPVPLHRWRIWRRGYNQAALIAQALARRHGFRVELDLLHRTRATPVLRGLGPTGRKKAVRGAFAVAANRRTLLAGRPVLLIDDIYTTGATANACARALKRAGAGQVGLLCWARVVRGVDN
ncbi:MAG TPA: ComF family protein [Sphingomonadaceae bacterium]|nr:ComF family protein [Sphingomonadaceae bacterium]